MIDIKRYKTYSTIFFEFALYTASNEMEITVNLEAESRLLSKRSEQ